MSSNLGSCVSVRLRFVVFRLQGDALMARARTVMRPYFYGGNDMLLYTDKVVLMNMLTSLQERPKTRTHFDFMLSRYEVTEDDVRGWIQENGGNVPKIYYQDYCEQIDVDRWSDKTDVFTPDGEHANKDDFREGDILELLDMPFDERGCHASGYAIWGRAAAGNLCWITEYDPD